MPGFHERNGRLLPSSRPAWDNLICSMPQVPRTLAFARCDFARRSNLNAPLAALSDLRIFDEVIDVRTPLEFDADHIPGASNAPVLTDDERILVGTHYKQVSAFEATRMGAAMVARNIAYHLDTAFKDRPRTWRPLIYCWRGGKRSGAMTIWLNAIGWKACQLDGGYKAYRKDVRERLTTLPTQFEYIVLTGNTGSGKTRLLRALERAGEQILDLEGLACHRGSVLGEIPGKDQPTQKAFDSQLVAAFRKLSPKMPVFVEAESKRIGQLYLPGELSQALHQSKCVCIETALEERISFLCDDYRHLFDDPAYLKGQLDRLVDLLGRETIHTLHSLVEAGSMQELYRRLILQYYDPAYRRSSDRYFKKTPHSIEFVLHPNDPDLIDQASALARRVRTESVDRLVPMSPWSG